MANTWLLGAMFLTRKGNHRPQLLFSRIITLPLVDLRQKHVRSPLHNPRQKVR